MRNQFIQNKAVKGWHPVLMHESTKWYSMQLVSSNLVKIFVFVYNLSVSSLARLQCIIYVHNNVILHDREV